MARFSWRLHITYSIWVIVGCLLSGSVPFIGDKVVRKPENFAMIGVFGLVQIVGFFSFLQKLLSGSSFSTIIVSLLLSLPLLVLRVITAGAPTWLLGGFSGRLMNMFDPSYATNHIPIIASVSEHQTPSWGRCIVDCGFLLLLMPLGCYVILRGGLTEHNEIQFLLLVYGLSTMYFAAIMARLVLVFAPAMTFLAGFGIHKFMRLAVKNRNQLSIVMTFSVFAIVVAMLLHSVWWARHGYLSDRVRFPVNAAWHSEDSDDYREGYRWLWSNTGKNERVMSWWDYGYQISSMGGRGCHADGNTNNFTQIGIIGMTMSSLEEESWRLARMMEADYMFVIFGGACSYDDDDVNQFLWMPRVANQTFHNISDEMYIGPEGLVGEIMAPNMSNAMLFKFCYYSFG